MMDTRTGEIGTFEELKKGKKKSEIKKFLRRISIENLSAKNRRIFEKGGQRIVLSRNSTCPCGSGKRFKRCCMIEGKKA